MSETRHAARYILLGRWPRIGPDGWPPFAAASFALFALLIGSNLVTPLFPVYAKVYGLPPLGVSLLPAAGGLPGPARW